MQLFLALFPSFVVFLKSWSGAGPHPRPPRKALEIGLRFSTFIRSAVPRGQMQDFENETRGALFRQKATLSQPAEFYNNRETRLDAPNRTAVPLPEVRGIFRSRTISGLPTAFPLLSHFLNPAFAGESPGLSKLENSEAPFRKPFRSCVRLASAPLHEASKTRKFGTMLKAEIGREQLAFGSDNLSANFNA